MQPERSATPVSPAPRSKAAAAALVAMVACLWLVGAASVWRVKFREVDTYGLKQSQPGLNGDPIWLVPSLLTIPFAIVVGWALKRSRSRWPMAIAATLPAVGMAVYVAVFILTLRFVGDDGPVGTFEIGLSWLVYGCTAALHALTICVTAWRLK